MNALTLEQFNEAHRLYYSALCWHVSAMLVTGEPYERAKDVVQEAFIRLWENRAKTDFLNAKAFLYVMVRNMAMNECRHEKVVRRHMEEVVQGQLGENDNEEVQKAIKFEMISLMYEAIEKLSDKKKEIIMTCIRTQEYGQLYKIALQFGITISTLKEHIKIARKHIMEYCLPRFKNI